MYGQDVRKAGDLKNLHDCLIHMRDLHFSLLIHGLLRGQQHPQSRGGDVLQLLKIEGERRHAVQRRLQLVLQLRRSSGVQPALQGKCQLEVPDSFSGPFI